MTFKGHIIFSISSIILIKKVTSLSYLFENNNWGHIIIGSLLTCLLPDIDHPQSWLGRKFKFISVPISKIFGHRGITHSLLAILMLKFFIEKNLLLILPSDIVNSMIISYISHIVADMLTPAGVPFFWPFFWRFRLPIIYYNKNVLYEKIFCSLFLVIALFYPLNINLFENLFKFFE